MRGSLSQRRWWGGAAVVALVYIVLVGAVMALTWGWTDRTPDWPIASYDEKMYHRPVIEQFAQQWPAVDLRDYASATTPGYHLLAAAVWRHTNPATVRVVSGLACVLAPLLLYGFVSRRLGPGPGALITCTVCLCNYVIGSAAFLTTDSFSLIFVIVALGAMLRALDGAGRRWLVIAAAAVIAVVLVRQIQVWLCGPLLVTAWLCRKHDRASLPIGMAGCAAAGAAVAYFLWLWGGLTPPSFAAQHGGGWNFAAIPYILSLFGLLGICYIGFLAPSRYDKSALLIGAAAGLVIALVFVTAPSEPAGRWAGVIWLAADKLPVIAGRSVVFIVLCPLGGAAVALWASRTWDRGGGVLLLSLLAFTIAHTANAQAWQRYYEPFLLILCALLASRSDVRRAWAMLGIAVLLIGLGVVTAVKVYVPIAGG
ncbi:MAG: glycosyltransferase family 39 protein [Phycisphaerales bacterium]|nr:glycosyltransferase family 39 protein [Phycisphaerales bacterium]